MKNTPSGMRHRTVWVFRGSGTSVSILTTEAGGYTASYSRRQKSSTVEKFFTEDLVLGDTENKVLGHSGTRLETNLPPQQLFCHMAGSSI